MAPYVKTITPAAVEPVTVAEAKTHLRVDHADDDVYIAALIAAARETVENWTNRSLTNQTYELVQDGWPAGDTFYLPRSPLQSVTSVKYKDSAGDESTLSSAAYLVDTDALPPRLRLKSGQTWPSVVLLEASAIRVRFVAGYGAAASAVPAALKQAVLLLVAGMYENRENETTARTTEIVIGAMALMTPYRVWV